MWFGTWGGLCRYDGYKFKIYKHDPDDPNSLSDNWIFCVYEDVYGYLWIGTREGLNLFDVKAGRFIRFVHDEKNQHSLSSNVIAVLREDDGGNLWIGTYDGGLNVLTKDQREMAKDNPYLLSQHTSRFLHISADQKNPASLSHKSAINITKDREGALWISTLGGLDKIIVQGASRNSGTHDAHTLDYKIIRYRYHPNDVRGLSDNHISTVFQDRAHTMWIGSSRHGLYKLVSDCTAGKMRSTPMYCDAVFENFVHDPVQSGSIAHNDVRRIFEDSEGNFWIGTYGGGLDLYDRKTNSFTHHRHDESNPYSISDDVILSIFEDRGGIVWIGTRYGLSKYNKFKNQFSLHNFSRGSDTTFRQNDIWSICESRDGLLWFGSYRSGLINYNPRTKKLNTYSNDPKDPTSIWNNFVLALHEDRRGRLWVAHENGFSRFDRNANRFQKIISIPKDEFAIGFTSIAEEKDGKLWIGMHGEGLILFDPESGEQKRFRHDPANAKSLSDDYILSLQFDKHGNLWIGAGRGLNRFNNADSSFMRFIHDPHDAGSISNNIVLTIALDSIGILWCGTDGGGLNRFDPSTNSFSHFTEKDGLPSNLVDAILVDAHNRLWISTSRGLTCFDARKKQFRNYEQSDGLQSNEFNRSSRCIGRDGKMFFGGVRGVNAFFPDQLRDNHIIPKIVITDFLLFNKSVLSRPDVFPLHEPIHSTNEIILEYDQNMLTFEFTALDFSAPEKNQYRYRLEGFDDDWIQAGTNRYATYTNLSAGEYTFHVQGSNSDGYWNTEGASIRLTVRPPFWKTWWASMLYVGALGGILLALLRFERYRMKLKNTVRMKEMQAERLEEMNQLRSRFFANISHEFRTPITLILGPIDQLLKRVTTSEDRSRLEMVRRNAVRLLRLVNQLLDLSKLESGKMKLHLSRIDVTPFLRGVVMQFHSLAERKNICFTLTMDFESLVVPIDREKVEKILNNLLSNAFKFTPAHGEISVTIRHNEIVGDNLHRDAIEIHVKDNGDGIPEEAIGKIFDRFFQAGETSAYEGSGIGLALTKELVELHEGTIHVLSEEGRGAEFVVVLPIYNEPEAIVSDETEPDSIVTEELASVEPTHIEENPRILKDKPIVLIIEDNSDVRLFIRQQLHIAYSLLEAGDGAEGVAKAQDQIPDLIISDVMMPVMDGYEVCRRLKSDEKTSHIPIILLTAKASNDSKIAGLETGADDYLTKPYNFNELNARVRNLIESRRRLREKFSRGLVLEEKAPTLNPIDDAFLKKIIEAIETNMENPDFGIESLMEISHMSESQLRRKLKAVVDQTPAIFIRSLRLKRAANLLKEHAGTVTEIAYRVGFNNLSYFARSFREEFGVLPSEYDKHPD